MFRNYLKTALRNLLREKGTASLNIAGLTLGITCSLVLFLLIRHLSSFDTFHENKDRIYRIVSESDGNNGKDYTPGVPTVLPEAFRLDFPEAQEVTFASYRAGAMVVIPTSAGEPKKYEEKAGVVFAQSNFFKIFDRNIVSGDREKSLDDPNSAVISEKLAMKYFGRTDVVGEIVKHDTTEFKISAVMETSPPNTDFPFELMLSYRSIQSAKEKDGWGSINSDDQCYILLKPGEKIATLEARIPAFVEKNLGKDNYDHRTFVMQPLAELHYDGRFETFTYNTVSREMLTALSVIAIFLIVTACINFINLSTAEAIKRSKEVGIRKSLGSSKIQLVSQFLGETTLVTTIAIAFALGFAQLALSFLNPFLELNLSLNLLGDGQLWLFLLAMLMLVSLLAGLYPSFVVSGYNPVVALKNQISNKNTSGFFLRRSLVVVQFIISQFLIMATIVLVMQMNYFSKKELGFRKDAILLLPIPETEQPGQPDGSSKMKTLRETFLSYTGIEEVSLSSTPPSSGSVSSTDFLVEGSDQRYETQIKQVDHNYFNLYDLKLVAGRPLIDSDTANGFVVNEELVKVLELKNPEDILGKNLKLGGRTLPVVGVVQNFHTVSLRGRIEPVVMFSRIRGYHTMSLKVNQANYQDVIGKVQKSWEAAYPQYIFSYQFLDEHIREFYDGEGKMSILLSIFTSIAIFIGCLGLFGLATFMANQKRKEIGIRKVLGASVERIVFMFTSEFVRLMLLGFVVAGVVTWFVMSAYLKEFEYRVEVGPMVFIAGFVVTLLIAAITVGYRSLKAANADPVKSLKYE